MTPEQAQHETCTISPALQRCDACTFAPKKEPPTCPVHKCTCYWAGYGWICPLCEREAQGDPRNEHEREMDAWQEEYYEDTRGLLLGL